MSLEAPLAPAPLHLVDALLRDDRDAVRACPKCDRHNHSLLGGRFADCQQFAGGALRPPPARLPDIGALNQWIVDNILPHFEHAAGVEFLIRAAFRQARADGVTLLAMSSDISYQKYFEPAGGTGGAAAFVELLRRIHAAEAPTIDYRPELGIARLAYPLDEARRWLDAFLATGYFCALDLYDRELDDPIEHYVPLFRAARAAGLTLKAHAGEFGDADSVWRAVETLELAEVQHGIAAASSPAVMRFLADHRVRLNVCPTSNVVLGRAASYAAHPIRVLIEHGVRVSIASDDVTLFGQGVSDEYWHLFRAGTLSATQLEQIRRDGLVA